MTKEQIVALHERVAAMTKERRELLDPICDALDDYQRATDTRREGSVVANRVAALAAVDVVEAWARTVTERD